MTISTEAILFIISLVTFLGAIIGGAVKYGTDKQKLESKNEIQDLKLENLAKELTDQKDHNTKQHEEFYDNKNTVIELANDMKHIKTSLSDIKALLSNGRRGADHG